jgi:transcription termination factor Rho
MHMAVLERSELQESPLADLHAIANQLGLDGFRRLRKAELIETILAASPGARDVADEADAEPEQAPRKRLSPRRRRPARSRARADEEEPDEAEEKGPARTRARPRGKPAEDELDEQAPAKAARARARPRRTGATEAGEEGARVAEGVIELLDNGSAFLRVSPPDPSDEDVYVSAAQVRRCELVSGDRVSGPARTPRRSERYPSLVRVDSINGQPADAVSGGMRYDELAARYPSERLALDSADPTLQAIEWLTPLGRGSRAVVVGAERAGKTETLRRLCECLRARPELQLSVVLAGVRPEEIGEWEAGPVRPVAALSFAATAESQGRVAERAIEEAKRIAARGGDAVVLLDGLDGMQPQVARKLLAAARNLSAGGSLTVIATARTPFGGETTVIALDAALTSTGRQPIVDLLASGTLRPELLVGDDGARAITRARAAALEAA